MDLDLLEAFENAAGARVLPGDWSAAAPGALDSSSHDMEEEIKDFEEIEVRPHSELICLPLSPHSRRPCTHLP